MNKLLFGCVAALAAGVASAEVDWRVTAEEAKATPHWMIESALRAVDTNEVVVANVPRDMKLFLLIGQSNMAGRGTLSAAALRSELKCPDAPFLIGEIGTLPRDCTAMNPVLAAAAASIPNGKLVRASDLKGHLPDGVHFDTPSYKVFGARYYEAWKSCASPASVASAESLAVDANVPAGNIVVEKIADDAVWVHQDLRDSSRDWIYWKFRVTGAAGRPLKFRFTKSTAVGSRGPAVSTDCGKTWAWGDDIQPSAKREPQTNDHGDSLAFDWLLGEAAGVRQGG